MLSATQNVTQRRTKQAILGIAQRGEYHVEKS